MNIGKEEEMEEDFDDTVTEAAPSPGMQETIEELQSQPEPISVPVHEQQPQPQPEPEPQLERGREKERTRKDDEKKDKERVCEHRSRSNHRRDSRSKEDKERWEFVSPQVVNNDDKGDSVPIASRIRIRRQTTVGDRPSSPKPAKATKRRMSVMDRLPDDSNRNRSEIVNDTVSTRAKKMRLSSGASDKETTPKKVSSRSTESTQKQTTNSKDAKPTFVTSNHNMSTAPEKMSTITATTSATPARSITPVLGTKSAQKPRDKKSKSASTPLITTFFSQTSPLKCDTCPAILNSQNERNFHAKIHKRGRCTTCKQTIDNNNSMESVHKHMISCLFLGNQISQDYLTHLLKVKVNLDRLTPDKINDIQKSLNPTTVNCNTNDVFKKRPGPKSMTDRNSNIAAEKTAIQEEAKTQTEDGSDGKYG